MDRRKSIKAIILGTISAGVFIEACSNEDKPAHSNVKKQPEFNFDRTQYEIDRDTKLMNETFFTKHEMETIAVLSDIIIPADEVSGSATEAGVPDFIEFIVKDMPQHQEPMRNGLSWLDAAMEKNFGKKFIKCSTQQQIEMVDQIAYPLKAKPEMKEGVEFFNKMRDLTVTGFYTSQIGVKDLGYEGNKPNKWNGVPDDVLAQYGLSYSEKELKECARYDV